ncbi:MAG: hypothetical protein WCR02_00995 [Sphaerochaetaceae bacterium]
MRIRNLLIGDIRFEFKYGFYFIYLILTIFYLALLLAFPASWRQKAATLMIFSDPAAMGLFFMGAIVLLEKSQRVIDALTVSPVTVTEYIASKVISLSFISVIVAMVLALFSGNGNLIWIFVGTLLSSIIFSLLGLIVATKISSLNQFFVRTIPIEILCFAPAALFFFDYWPQALRWYPFCICLGLLADKNENPLSALLMIAATLSALLLIAHRSVEKMWKSEGGVKL